MRLNLTHKEKKQYSIECAERTMYFLQDLMEHNARKIYIEILGIKREYVNLGRNKFVHKFTARLDTPGSDGDSLIANYGEQVNWFIFKRKLKSEGYSTRCRKTGIRIRLWNVFPRGMILGIPAHTEGKIFMSELNSLTEKDGLKLSYSYAGKEEWNSGYSVGIKIVWNKSNDQNLADKS